MNKQLENKIGHQGRELAALRDKVTRLEKHCLELQHQDAEYKYANDQAFRILGGVK